MNKRIQKIYSQQKLITDVFHMRNLKKSPTLEGLRIPK